MLTYPSQALFLLHLTNGLLEVSLRFQVQKISQVKFWALTSGIGPQELVEMHVN